MGSNIKIKFRFRSKFKVCILMFKIEFQRLIFKDWARSSFIVLKSRLESTVF